MVSSDSQISVSKSLKQFALSSSFYSCVLFQAVCQGLLLSTVNVVSSVMSNMLTSLPELEAKLKDNTTTFTVFVPRDDAFTYIPSHRAKTLQPADLLGRVRLFHSLLLCPVKGRVTEINAIFKTKSYFNHLCQKTKPNRDYVIMLANFF